MTGVPEAPLERTENGVQAAGEGWFVVNARDAVWGESETMGVFTRLGENVTDWPKAEGDGAATTIVVVSLNGVRTTVVLV